MRECLSCKKRSWMIVLDFINHPTSKSRNNILRWCYNILAALQESYNCVFTAASLQSQFLFPIYEK